MAKQKLSSTVVVDQPFKPEGFTLSKLFDNPTEQARFMGKYTSHYYAGAFAHPTRADLEDMQDRVDLYGTEDAPMIVVTRKMDRAGRRRDFTGDNFPIPAGVTMATTVCRHHDAPIPDLTHLDYVTIYPEDHELRDELVGQGFRRAATRCTPQAEVIAIYANEGQPIREYTPFDSATIQVLPIEVPEELREAFLTEVDLLDTLGGWRDDVPFYNAGAWGSLSLRGYWHDDPTRGSKPDEMSQAYKAQHPEDADRVSGWTVAAEQCPTIVSWVDGFGWELDRVRIVRLEPGGGELERHTDGIRNRDLTRLHIPLITNPGAILHNWTIEGDHLETNLWPWSTFYLDTRKPHAVRNDGTEDRIHLVVDFYSTDEMFDLIGQSWVENPDSRGVLEDLL